METIRSVTHSSKDDLNFIPLITKILFTYKVFIQCNKMLRTRRGGGGEETELTGEGGGNLGKRRGNCEGKGGEIAWGLRGEVRNRR